MKKIFLFSLLYLLPLAHGYENFDYGFSLRTPSGWNYANDSYVLAVFTSQGSGAYEPRISINVLDRTRTDVDAVMNQIQQAYANLFTYFVVEEEINYTMMDLPSRGMICTWRQGSYDLKMKEIVIQKTNRYYDFGYIAVDEDFNANLKVFEGCIESLSLNDPLYTDSTSGISFSYPSGWAVDDTSFENMAMFYGPEVDGFLTNIVFASEAWDGDTWTFVQNQKEQMDELLTGYQLLENGTVAMAEGVGRNLVYSYEIPGPKIIKARAVMFCRDETAYSIVYTSLYGAYDKSMGQYERTLSTFQLGDVSQLFFSLVIISFVSIGILRDF